MVIDNNLDVAQQSVGFQPRNPAPMPPHIESARNLLFEKLKLDQLSCRQL